MSWLVVRSYDQVMSFPMGGFASVRNMLDSSCYSTTLWAAVLASSSFVTPVCDFTLPMCVLYPRVPLVWMISSASYRRSL